MIKDIILFSVTVGVLVHILPNQVIPDFLILKGQIWQKAVFSLKYDKTTLVQAELFIKKRQLFCNLDLKYIHEKPTF